MVWEPFQEGWQNGLAAAIAYREAAGHLRVPQSFVSDDGFRLGAWISERRTERRDGKLNAERKAQLDALGMIWDARRTKS